jgi:hypothetical protein
MTYVELLTKAKMPKLTWHFNIFFICAKLDRLGPKYKKFNFWLRQH